MSARSSTLKQYYVAVGTSDAKIETLLDLLRAFNDIPAHLGAVVCCSARDSLDVVCGAVLALPDTRVWAIHADMSEWEIDSHVSAFKHACTQHLSEQKKVEERAVLLSTDPCIKIISKELLPLTPSLLINYDLPAKKDIHLRRITNVVGSRAHAPGQRIVVHFAVAGQLEQFRAVEEFSGDRQILEMPVHVSDILK